MKCIGFTKARAHCANQSLSSLFPADAKGISIPRSNGDRRMGAVYWCWSRSPPSNWAIVTATGSLRSRLYGWDWFQQGKDGKFGYLEALFRF